MNKTRSRWRSRSQVIKMRGACYGCGQHKVANRISLARSQPWGNRLSTSHFVLVTPGMEVKQPGDPALQHLCRPLLAQLTGASEVTGNMLSFVGMGPPLSGLELETVSLLDRKLKISNRAMDKATVKMTEEDPFHVEFNRRQQRSPWNRCTDAQEWLKSNPDFQQTFEGSGGASQGNTKRMAHWE